MIDINKNIDKSLEITKQARENLFDRLQWREEALPAIKSFAYLKENVEKELNFLLYYSFPTKVDKLFDVYYLRNSKKGFKTEKGDYSLFLNNTSGLHEKHSRQNISYDNVVYIDKQTADIYIGYHTTLLEELTSREIGKDTIKKLYLLQHHWKDDCLNTFLDFLVRYKNIPAVISYNRRVSIDTIFDYVPYKIHIDNDDDFYISVTKKEKTIFYSSDVFDDGLAFNTGYVAKNKLFNRTTTNDELEKTYKDFKDKIPLLLHFNDVITKAVDEYNKLYKDICEITQPMRVLEAIRAKK